MHFSFRKAELFSILTPRVVMFCAAGTSGFQLPAGLPGGFAKHLREELDEHGFAGKVGEVVVVATNGLIPAKRVVVAGLGAKKNLSAEVVRRAAAHVARRFMKQGVTDLAVVLPDGLPAPVAAQALMEGMYLAQYRYSKYRTAQPDEKKDLETCTVLVADATALRQAQAVAEGVAAVLSGVSLARDLVNEPASVATPKHLADTAKEIAKMFPTRITVEVLNRAQCEKKGMGAFLAVAQGAHEEPYFIHLTYKPTRKAKKSVAVVGKGITFDSGGLQIKSDHGMQTMKCDMSGAAAVLGLFQALPTLRLPVEVHGVIAATENMPGPRAYKPGDVVRSMSGKTIEIGHTDAEGRVTLADSLAFAVALEPDAVIDLATLTGAAVVALGEEVAALMTNTPKLGEKVKQAAELSGERFWELPLVEEYRDLIKGTHGDVSNSGSTRYGGTITAGLFLREFVGDVPWVHLDIAGPAWAERDSIPYVPKGGTGFGIRTLVRFLEKFT